MEAVILRFSVKMNRVIIFIVVVLLAASCGSNDQAVNSGNHATMPEQEKILREQIEKHPDSAMLRENLIQYFRDNSNYTKAIGETDALLKSDSNNERLLYIKATLLSENDDTLQAIKTWEKLIMVEPRPEYLMSVGTLYAFSKDPRALDVADLLANAKSNAKYQSLFISGLYYNSINEQAKATVYFDQCIALDYTNTLAYREKAIAEYDMGKYLDALKTLELALAVKSSYDEAYYWMGRCYEKLGKKEAAIDNYKQALQLSPNYIEAKDALAKMGVRM